MIWGSFVINIGLFWLTGASNWSRHSCSRQDPDSQPSRSWCCRQGSPGGACHAPVYHACVDSARPRHLRNASHFLLYLHLNDLENECNIIFVITFAGVAAGQPGRSSRELGRGEVDVQMGRCMELSVWEAAYVDINGIDVAFDVSAFVEEEDLGLLMYP